MSARDKELESFPEHILNGVFDFDYAQGSDSALNYAPDPSLLGQPRVPLSYPPECSFLDDGLGNGTPHAVVNTPVQDGHARASSNLPAPTLSGPHVPSNQPQWWLHEDAYSSASVDYLWKEYERFANELSGGSQIVAPPSLPLSATPSSDPAPFTSHASLASFSTHNTSVSTLQVGAGSPSTSAAGPSSVPGNWSDDDFVVPAWVASAGRSVAPSGALTAASTVVSKRSASPSQFRGDALESVESAVGPAKRPGVDGRRQITPSVPPVPSDVNVRPQEPEERTPRPLEAPQTVGAGVPAAADVSVMGSTALNMPLPRRTPLVRAPSVALPSQRPFMPLSRARSVGPSSQRRCLPPHPSTTSGGRARTLAGRGVTPIPLDRNLFAQRHMMETGIPLWPYSKPQARQELHTPRNGISDAATQHSFDPIGQASDFELLAMVPSLPDVLEPHPPFNPDLPAMPIGFAPDFPYFLEPSAQVLPSDAPISSSTQIEAAGPSSSSANGRKRKNTSSESTPVLMPVAKKPRRSKPCDERAVSPVPLTDAVASASPPPSRAHPSKKPRRRAPPSRSMNEETVNGPMAPGAGHPDASHALSSSALAPSPSPSREEGPPAQRVSPVSDEDTSVASNKVKDKWKRGTYIAFQFDVSHLAQKFPEGSLKRKGMDSLQEHMQTHIGFTGTPDLLETCEEGRTKVDVQYLASEELPLDGWKKSYLQVLDYFFERDPLAKQTARARKALETVRANIAAGRHPDAYEPPTYPWFARFDGTKQYTVFGTKLLVTRYEDSDETWDLSDMGLKLLNTRHHRDTNRGAFQSALEDPPTDAFRALCTPPSPVPARVWRDVDAAPPSYPDPLRFVQEVEFVKRWYLFYTDPSKYPRPPDVPH
ncbi:hypothetical protein DAEQUDRAFT_768560 [Daedalea quercina L-15889]|uniref:Uncharacterized protein n=1 Tax=Daedalea quercina L-15889 TaxID=1314783 RepID=A0A165MLL4_9APHY|nr:hypothetical protein DAEQUDRAFT_768560 [Daedalea quercina L-15889]